MTNLLVGVAVLAVCAVIIVIAWGILNLVERYRKIVGPVALVVSGVSATVLLGASIRQADLPGWALAALLISLGFLIVALYAEVCDEDHY